MEHKNEDQKPHRINLCMSGGRTSAYMVEHALRLHRKGIITGDLVITFANTGMENPKTLVFVNKCDYRWQKLYGHSVVWLEAVFHKGRKPSSHKVVSFETATRGGGLFDKMCEKYGLPNSQFLHCTRELKENPIMSYMESMGEKKGHTKGNKLVPATYETWIGIRSDEPRRLGGKMLGKQKKVYPLAYGFGEGKDFIGDVSKLDVLDFWSNGHMGFDLEIPEHQGNCVDCHKKSFKKLAMVYRDDGNKPFVSSAYLDTAYSKVKAQVLNGEVIERRRYRGYRDTKQMIEYIKLIDVDGIPLYEEDSGGCSESCEPFMDE